MLISLRNGRCGSRALNVCWIDGSDGKSEDRGVLQGVWRGKGEGGKGEDVGVAGGAAILGGSGEYGSEGKRGGGKDFEGGTTGVLHPKSEEVCLFGEGGDQGEGGGHGLLL